MVNQPLLWPDQDFSLLFRGTMHRLAYCIPDILLQLGNQPLLWLDPEFSLLFRVVLQ